MHLLCPERTKKNLLTVTRKAGNYLPPFPPSSSLEKKLWLGKWGGRPGSVRNRKEDYNHFFDFKALAELNWERG